MFCQIATGSLPLSAMASLQRGHGGSFESACFSPYHTVAEGRSTSQASICPPQTLSAARKTVPESPSKEWFPREQQVNSSAHQPPQLAPANGIDICYEIFGDAHAEPLLLIMGLGAQMIHWDDEFCAQLAARGFRVIRFDIATSANPASFRAVSA